MKRILINIKNKALIFTYKTNNSNINNDLMNTNIINNNELIFSDEYIIENSKILSSFIRELTIQYNVNTCIITKLSLASLVINLLKRADNIHTLYIREEEILTYAVCEALINIKHIKVLNCYSIYPFMIELLDKNNIIVESRCEILYISNFMENNNLVRYSDLYYKNDVKITLPLALEDVQDFENFCKVNKYLRNIHVNKLITTELENLVKILIDCNRRNINIIIHENLTDEKTAEYLKKINKNYRRKHQISLSLEYSLEYLNNNLIKQSIINLLKVCGLIISSLIVLVITYISISNYKALNDVNKIKGNISNIIKDVNTEEIINQKEENNVKEVEEKFESEENSEEEKNEEINNLKSISNKDLASLLAINEDVIGHLKVNNINIDYPVVQTDDNSFYLDHDFNKKESIYGWLFMDYRVDAMFLNKNNIIYGHNVYYGGIMFGTLYKAANKSWYTNPENQIITYDSLYENMQFRIFSIYRVPKTTDYLRVVFKDDDDFLSFIKMISDRSYYDFNVPINADDKILTLSTCSDNGTKRLVVHAVRIQ